MRDRPAEIRIPWSARFRAEALHVFTLGAFAVAQPLFEVLHRTPEFFVAHRSDRIDLLLLVVALWAAVPGMIVLAAWLAGRISRQAQRGVVGIAIAALTATVILQVAKALAEPAAAWWIAGAGAVGVAAAILHARTRSLRTFMTLLAPGLIIFPVLFLLRPSLAPFVFPQARAAGTSPVDAQAPIVLIVFDQLPLISLLDEHGRIDRASYPAFAELADSAVWFRNATTVSDLTAWALPAILTGELPDPSKLPLAEHHPRSLFTRLGASYRLNVVEPITALCPQELCPHDRASRPDRLFAMTSDLAIVYLHIILPSDLSMQLPPVTQNWKDFAATETWRARWVRERDRDRRQAVADFIDSIRADETPALHFLHALLPHEPFVYLPSGQIFTASAATAGLLQRERWTDDEFAVAQAYQRHLLQVGYVDALLGRILSHLKREGLFDQALIVVTSDHGASFRPGRAFKAAGETTPVDIAAVPLFVKRPDQREGVLSDRNVESIDILPTIADALGIDLGWPAGGVSALGDDPERPAKTLFFDGARQRMSPAPVADGVPEAIARKLSLFGRSDENPYRIPRIGPQHGLVGRSIRELRVSDGPGVSVTLDAAWRYARVDPAADAFPAHLMGQIQSHPEPDERVPLAVAVNGTIRATLWSFAFPVEGRRHVWSAVLAPDAFRAGWNDVEIFHIVEAAGRPVLQRAFRTAPQPHLLNLASVVARDAAALRQTGLHEREWSDGRSYRWTDGSATIVAPIDRRNAPQSLRLVLAMGGADNRPLRIVVNGCEIFDGVVPAGRWSGIFALTGCPLDGDEAAIELLSGSSEPGDLDARRLGVAVEALNLLDLPWPPSGDPLQVGDCRSELALVGEPVRTLATERASVGVRIRHVGTAPWPRSVDLGGEAGSVRLGIRWHRPGTAAPAAEHHVELPQTMYPGDDLTVPVWLEPRDASGRRLPAGRYDVWIGLLQEGVAWFHERGDNLVRLTIRVER